MTDVVMWAGCPHHADPTDLCTLCVTAVDINKKQADKLKTVVFLPWYTPDGRRP